MKKQGKIQEKPSPTQRKTAILMQLFLCFLAILFLSSCHYGLPVPQEMGNMALLRTFAVDLETEGVNTQENQWQVTVSTDKQQKANSDAEALVLSAQAKTLSGACQQIHGNTEDYVFFGYVDQLILGEILTNQGIMPVLQYFATEPQCSLGTSIWLAQGQAGDLLSTDSDQSTPEHLQTLRQESRLGVGGISRKVGEVMADLKDQGASFMPILTPMPENQVLRQNSYGIIKGDSLVAVLTENQAQGLELLESQPQLLEVTLAEGTYALQLQEISRQLSLQYQEETLDSVVISLKIQAEILEKPENPRENILPQVEEEITALLEDFLSTCADLEADPLNLGGYLAVTMGCDLETEGQSFHSLPQEILVQVNLPNQW